MSADRAALAMLLLDAYQGTIDDEGEGEVEARHAIAVSHSLGALARDGVSDVGAVITDGKVASERRFRRLEFARVGPWG